MAIAETAASKLLHGFFAHIFAAIADAAHLLVPPLETLWQWLATSTTDASGAISSGLDGLWQLVAGSASGMAIAETAAWKLLHGFFAHVFPAIAGAAHPSVPPLETLWQWLATITTDAAGAISSGLDALWQLVTGFFPAGGVATLSAAAHEIPQKLGELWRWIQAAAAAALPFTLGVAAVVLVAALLWFCWTALFAVSVVIVKAHVLAACYNVHGLFYAAVAVHWVLSFLLPPCMLCLKACAVVTMKAPGVAGTVISRGAFEAFPALFYQIARAAPPVVVATVFCTKTVAWLVAAPVAALFRASAGRR